MKCHMGSLLSGGLLAAFAGLLITITVLILVAYLKSKDKADAEVGENSGSEN